MPSKASNPKRAGPGKPRPARWAAKVRKVLPPDEAVRPPALERLAALEARAPKPLREFWRQLGWGRFGQGFLLLCDPSELDETLAAWLGVADPSRIPLGRTALGDLIYFRDLRERARGLGMRGTAAENANDVSVVDVRYRHVRVIATSLTAFENLLGDPETLERELRKDLFDAALPRLGPPGAAEVYGFVPTLALGGEERPESLQRMDAAVHLELLRQLEG